MIVEADLDDRMVDVGGKARREDGRCSLVAERQGSRKGALAVERPREQRVEPEVAAQPQAAAGPDLVVVLDGRQEAAGG